MLGSAECYSTHKLLTRPSVSVFWPSNPPLRCAWASFYTHKGSPTGGNADKGKMEKGNCGWYSYLYSVSYLTLMAGDKGIKCPSASPKQCKKGPSGTPPLATMAILSASHATAHHWLHSLSPRAPGKVPRETRWWMCWSAGTEWLPVAASALPRPLSCRARKLVAHRALPGRAARRGKFLAMPWLPFPASSSCRGLVFLA